MDLLIFLILMSLILLLLHVSYFTDLVLLESGFKLRSTHLTETVFHLGIVNNLIDIFPPVYPYASGISFSHYHMNMHLEIEMFNRLFSIDTLKLTFFYYPFLYFSLLIFMPYFFVYKFSGKRFLAILTGVLIVGSDLSFIPGLFADLKPDFPWTSIFQSTIWSIFTLNGILPAIPVLILFIVYLKKYCEQVKMFYLVLLIIVGFSAFGFKSSMGYHLMGTAFLTGIFIAFTQDRRKGLHISIISALTLLAMFIEFIALREGTGNIEISFSLFNNFLRSLNIIGISEISWMYYPVLFVLYVLLTFGARIFGFYLVRDMIQKRPSEPTIFFLVLYTASGFIVSEALYIGDVFHIENNSVFFSIQSLIGAWLLLSYFLYKARHQSKKFAIYVCITIFLSAPSTVQFLFLRFSPDYYYMSSDDMEVVRYLRNTSNSPSGKYRPSFACIELCRKAIRNQHIPLFCPFDHRGRGTCYQVRIC
jgi:hypothetical protein